MAGMNDNRSTWRKSAAELLAICAVLALLSGIVNINYPGKDKGSDNRLFYLAMPALIGVIAALFYLLHLVHKRKP
jgi:hypothetical protein